MNNKKQKLLNLLSDDKIDQESYDNAVEEFNIQLEKLRSKIQTIQNEETNLNVNIQDLKNYIL